jgi:putative colanic acid biosynthesis UDP-glucose lipid carrier transferase
MQFYTFVYVLIAVQQQTMQLLQQGIKFIIDFLFALGVTIFILTWLVPLLWITNLFVDGGPLFFSHQREGKDRKLFNCYKFRTIPSTAKHVKPGESFNIKTTFLGTLLRNTGIDELPQAINILKGEMSVVGPRPHLPEYNAYYQSFVGKPHMDKRLQVLPGLTGLAQVWGYRGDTPNEASIKNRIDSDAEYVEYQSLWLDLKIIFLSAIALFRGIWKHIF